MLQHVARLLITTAFVAPLFPAPAAAQTAPIIEETGSAPSAGEFRTAGSVQAGDPASTQASNARPQDSAATPGSAPDQASAQRDTIGDIVVTAQRVESSAQRTPISIQVYSGETLAARGVSDLRQLANIDPSIGINSAGGQTTIAVRGIASSNVTETGEPAVSVSVDGAFNNRGYS
uniref:TonB-dependent receptor plug domain-containing protein n=1 Tax=Sphingomonas sp. TaxID=28214 RepID=UPI0035BC8E15